MAFERPEGVYENIVYALFIVVPATVLINAFSQLAAPGSSRVLFGAGGGLLGSIIGYYFFDKTKNKPLKIRLISLSVVWLIAIGLFALSHVLKPIVD